MTKPLFDPPIDPIAPLGPTSGNQNINFNTVLNRPSTDDTNEPIGLEEFMLFLQDRLLPWERMHTVFHHLPGTHRPENTCMFIYLNSLHGAIQQLTRLRDHLIDFNNIYFTPALQAEMSDFGWYLCSPKDIHEVLFPDNVPIDNATLGLTNILFHPEVCRRETVGHAIAVLSVLCQTTKLCPEPGDRTDLIAKLKMVEDLAYAKYVHPKPAPSPESN